MTPKAYYKVLSDRWLALVATVAVCVVLAAGYVAIRPANYTAALTMYVSSQADNSPNAAYQGSLLSQQRVKSYTALVNSERVLSEVKSQLTLPETTDELSHKVAATSALDSVLIDVSVSDPDPVRAAQIANTVGNVFTSLVADIERPVSPGAIQAVRISVVQPAVPPTVSSSISPVWILLAAALIGLLLGVSIAVLRETLDESIRSSEEAQETTSRPNLAIVPFDQSIQDGSSGIVISSAPFAESVRQLRTNLQFVNVDDPMRTIAITSSLPDEGKSTMAVALAGALSLNGNRVILVDADLRKPRISALLGVSDGVGLTNVISGRTSVEHVIQHVASQRIDVLVSGTTPPNPSELLSSNQAKTLFDKLKNSYDYVIIDSPPLLPVTDTAAMSAYIDSTLLIIKYGGTKRRDVQSAMSSLEAVNARVVGNVVTMSPLSQSRYRTYYSHSDRRAQVEETSSANKPRPAPQPRRQANS